MSSTDNGPKVLHFKQDKDILGIDATFFDRKDNLLRFTIGTSPEDDGCITFSEVTEGGVKMEFAWWKLQRPKDMIKFLGWKDPHPVDEVLSPDYENELYNQTFLCLEFPHLTSNQRSCQKLLVQIFGF